LDFDFVVPDARGLALRFADRARPFATLDFFLAFDFLATDFLEAFLAFDFLAAPARFMAAFLFFGWEAGDTLDGRLPFFGTVVVFGTALEGVIIPCDESVAIFAVETLDAKEEAPVSMVDTSLPSSASLVRAMSCE
jgi:hypothetical protein